MRRKRTIPALNIRNSAHRKLEGLAKRHRLTLTSLVNRLVDWLDAQPQLIQAAVLGKFPGTVDRELAKLLVRSITRSS